MANPLEQEIAQLRETISQYQQKENDTRTKFNQMKDRLKEALDDKRDFEIEFLQLQKNYLRVKNSKPNDEKPSQQNKGSDRERLNRLIAQDHKQQEELKALKEDNDLLKS